MRNILFVALLVALATVVGCKSKEPQQTENTMSSTEQQKQKMQQSPDAMEDTSAAAQPPAGEGDAATQ